MNVLLEKALGKGQEKGKSSAQIEDGGVVDPDTDADAVTAGERGGTEGRTVSTGFVPYSLSKGKKAAMSATAVTAPVVDFFGLGMSLSSTRVIDCTCTCIAH